MSKIICENCKEAIEGKPKRTFLGFQRYTCQSCKKPTVYPLTSGYRAIYWSLIVVFSLGTIMMALQGGNILFPNIFIIGAIVALVKDRSMQKNKEDNMIRKDIEETTPHICECGNTLSRQAKFCNYCGKKINMSDNR